MLASLRRGHVDNLACFALQNDKAILTQGWALHRVPIWCTGCSAFKFSSVGHGSFLTGHSNTILISNGNSVQTYTTQQQEDVPIPTLPIPTYRLGMVTGHFKPNILGLKCLNFFSKCLAIFPICPKCPSSEVSGNLRDRVRNKNRHKLHLWLRRTQTVTLFPQVQVYCNVTFVKVVAVERETVGIATVGMGNRNLYPTATQPRGQTSLCVIYRHFRHCRKTWPPHKITCKYLPPLRN